MDRAGGALDAVLNTACAWAAGEPGISAVALVGSHARGTALPGSDIDLVILASSPAAYFEDTSWAGRFGAVERTRTEDYGLVTSLRVFYANGLEIEFGFAAPAWAEPPLDHGTLTVVSHGMRALYDPQGLLAAMPAGATPG